MGKLATFWFLDSPLNQHRKLHALRRYLSWQIGSRLAPGPIAVTYVNQSQLLVYPGMTGATGNVYAGLHEFEDMAFVLHALRPEDLFVDVGANIGSYTILAGAAVGAACQSYEPVPSTYAHLCKNINLNGISGRVDAQNIGVGDSPGKLLFTSGHDTINHVVSESDAGANTVEVPIKTLNDLCAGKQPRVIKIDVEGFETPVIEGAENVFKQTDALAVVMELNGAGRRYGYDDENIHRMMLDFGFETFKYKPFTRQLTPLGGEMADSSNTLYIRQPSFFADRVAGAPRFAVHGQSI